MRKTRAFLLGSSGGTRYYHVVSRTAGQERLFDEAAKEMFMRIMHKQLQFSGLRAVAWCFMGNHFHLLLDVPDKATALAEVTDAMAIERLQVFRDEFSTRMLLGDVETYRQIGDTHGVRAIADRIRARLFDLSMFMKEFKQRMTLAFNLAHGRTGTLWEGRFRSVLLEAGEAVRLVAAYIDLNPVRAGIVADPKEYRWCSYAAAVAGSPDARAGLSSATNGGDRGMPWQAVSTAYRKLIFGIGESSADRKNSSRCGFTQAQVEAVWEAGGKLSIAEVLRCRIRYFSAGAVLGSKQFLERFFLTKREQFGANRRSGARRMSGAEWGELRTLRALKLRPISAPEPDSQS